jgi:hypothetical protein
MTNLHDIFSACRYAKIGSKAINIEIQDGGIVVILKIKTSLLPPNGSTNRHDIF